MMKENPMCVITKQDNHLNIPFFLLFLLALSEEFSSGDLIVYCLPVLLLMACVDICYLLFATGESLFTIFAPLA